MRILLDASPNTHLLVPVLTQLSLACGCEVAAALIEIPTLPPQIPKRSVRCDCMGLCWLDQWQPMLVQLSLTRRRVSVVQTSVGWGECLTVSSRVQKKLSAGGHWDCVGSVSCLFRGTSLMSAAFFTLRLTIRTRHALRAVSLCR